MANKMTQFQQERILHLASKLVDYVYIPEEEDYWNQTGLHESTRDDGNNEWIDEDILNSSTHIFKCVYNLQKLLNQIKYENEQNN